MEELTAEDRSPTGPRGNQGVARPNRPLPQEPGNSFASENRFDRRAGSEQQDGSVQEDQSDESRPYRDVDYTIPGDPSDNAIAYLKRLVDGNAEKQPQLQLTDQEMVAVEAAFRSLQSRLGTAAKSCIQAYRRWGERFWQSSEKEAWDGLITSYWHQVMLTVGVRNRVMGRLNEQRLDIPYMPLLNTMVGKNQEFNPDAVSSENPIADNMITPALRTEYGHFRSINRRIRQDADIRCADGAAYYTVPCAIARSPKYSAWADMVENTVAERIGKKNRTAHADVLRLFQDFLISPNMVQWDNLISAASLNRLHVEWLNTNAAALSQWEGATNFANKETVRLYRELSNFGYGEREYGSWFAQPNNPRTWFPPGYGGMVRLFMGGERTWEYVNIIDNAGRTILPATLDLDENAFYREIKREATSLVRSNAPQDASDVAPVDASISRATDKARKKAQSKRAAPARARDPSEQAESIAAVLSAEIPFVPPPEGVEGPSLVTVEALYDQVFSIGELLIQNIPDLQENNLEATALITEIKQAFDRQFLLGQMAKTYCTMNEYLKDPNSDELYDATLAQLDQLQRVAYGVADNDEEMADAQPLPARPLAPESAPKKVASGASATRAYEEDESCTLQ